MTQEQEAEVQRLIKDVDVTELMGMLMKHGNRYSRRILKFFRWYYNRDFWRITEKIGEL